MRKQTITFPIDGSPIFNEVKKICAEFDCRLLTKQGMYYTVESTDPLNFFWLGMNLISKLKADQTTFTEGTTPGDKELTGKESATKYDGHKVLLRSDDNINPGDLEKFHNALWRDGLPSKKD